MARRANHTIRKGLAKSRYEKKINGEERAVKD
jgi:hypothetical protein